MPSRGSELSRSAFAGVVLVVLGLGLWALYPFTSGGERHSYAADEVAPYYVTVTVNHTYDLAIHGGVQSESELGLDPASLSCGLTQPGGGATSLTVAPEDPASTKAVNQIGTFVAPVSGRVHLTCVGIAAVFVDDADDASTDLAGLWLLLGSIALAVGLPLTLSVLRRHAADRADEDGWDDEDDPDDDQIYDVRVDGASPDADGHGDPERDVVEGRSGS